MSAAYFELEKRSACAWDFFSSLATNLYAPVAHPRPAFSADAFVGNALDAPALTGRPRLRSVPLGDTLSMLDGRLLPTLGARRQTLVVEDYACGSGATATPYDASRTSPMAGVVYKATPELSLHANHIEKLSQGATIAAQGGNPAVVLPLSKQNEVGVKVERGRVVATIVVLGSGLFLWLRRGRPRGPAAAAGVAQ